VDKDLFHVRNSTLTKH